MSISKRFSLSFSVSLFSLSLAFFLSISQSFSLSLLLHTSGTRAQRHTHRHGHVQRKIQISRHSRRHFNLSPQNTHIHTRTQKYAHAHAPALAHSVCVRETEEKRLKCGSTCQRQCNFSFPKCLVAFDGWNTLRCYCLPHPCRDGVANCSKERESEFLVGGRGGQVNTGQQKSK